MSREGRLTPTITALVLVAVAMNVGEKAVPVCVRCQGETAFLEIPGLELSLV